ncbi:MAG: hypothetical protein KJ950_07295 [Proteobacteria bacterium]|nr:hypothetical protein [Pseudomonadota bacterium]MBU1687050.1 hypothetical protein [Pseudomonadota bacterium]
MPDKGKCILFSGGLRGAESFFGEMAEKWGVKEVVYTYEGHVPDRERAVVTLSAEELMRGDISMELASRMMNRSYYQAEKLRKILQLIFHMVNTGHQIFVVGTIQDDNTVKGGTGWAVELGKLFNRPVHVYGQVRKHWYTWRDNQWQQDDPRIEHETFVGTGTRELTDDGRRAIEKLFTDSFGSP